MRANGGTMERKEALSWAALALLAVHGCAATAPDSAEDGDLVLPPPMGSPGSTVPPTGTTAPPSGTTTPPTGTTAPPPTGSGSAPPTGTTPPPPIAGAGGATVAPMAGAGGATVQPMAGSGAPPMLGPKTPTIPTVSAECPSFRDGNITFMGLGGIQVVAGSKPAGATAPMVFYWHGTGGSSGEFAFQASAVSAGVAAEGGVLISFQGTTGGDLLSGTAIFGAGDFELADQLVACAVRDANVDPRRIFATGCSAGGLFSTAMAAQRSNYMAAAAPNSGGLIFPGAFQNDYTPALMTIHGLAGLDVVVIDFSVSSATADDSFKGRGGFVINCDHGGGHCGGGGLAPDIWEFFKAHPYGVEPKPWTSLPPGFHSSCKIF
jgi:hypothetical protein